MKAASHVAENICGKSGRHTNRGSDCQTARRISIATDDGKRVRTGPAAVRIVKQAANPWYEITLIEGRNRQIRRMFEAVGHHVEKIKRVRYGPLTLDVPPGEYRSLTLKEVQRLKSATSGGTKIAG